ncbi:MAG TPA: tetratricopeptide repeat protein [Gaiellaceae bacterium]|nr:tetratricopeptide repeat protein [Gaiellaceae bacterium]
MSTSPFQVARLDELQRFEGEFTTVPVRIPLGISAFGVNAYEAAAVGGPVIEEHDELGAGAGHHEELYLVLRGHARFTVAGEEVDAPAGTLVFVRDPAARRGAEAVAPGTTVLVVGATRGEIFEPSPWESWLEALPSYTAGDYEEAVEIMRRGLERHPDNPNVLYNLACCEALAGRHEEALGHLARSAELDPRVVEWAREDVDLESVRGDDRFPR